MAEGDGDVGRLPAPVDCVGDGPVDPPVSGDVGSTGLTADGVAGDGAASRGGDKAGPGCPPDVGGVAADVPTDITAVVLAVLPAGDVAATRPAIVRTSPTANGHRRPRQRANHRSNSTHLGDRIIEPSPH